MKYKSQVEDSSVIIADLKFNMNVLQSFLFLFTLFAFLFATPFLVIGESMKR